MNRRRFLAGGGASIAGAIAGCLGGTGPSDSGGITLESVDVGGSPGGPISLHPPGKVVLLDFFATWCAPCKPEMANLRATRERFDPQRLFMVSITQETDVEAIERFWHRYDGTWPVVVDDDLEATRTYDVTGIPTIIVFTPGGEPVMRHTGLAGQEAIVTAVRDALDRAELT